MQTLATTGEWVHHQADVVHQVAHRIGHLAQLRHCHALARIEVEHQSRCRTGLSGRRESPLRHMHFQRGLLGDPGQAGRAIDDRIGRATRSVLDGGPVEPVGGRTGQLLFEERGLVDTVGPPLAGDRPAGDVRKHHVGDAGVVAEDVGLGGTGGRIQHLVGVGQSNAGARRRTRGPHVVHHPNVLPAASLGQ